LGFFLVTYVATCGACLCYFVSYNLGSSIVQKLFPFLLNSFRSRIKSHSDNLFFYLLFLRISPLLPNWFISLASPILNIPFSIFLPATLFGLMPANFIHIKTGIEISKLKDINHASNTSIYNFITLIALAGIALIPTLFQKKFKRFDVTNPTHRKQT